MRLRRRLLALATTVSVAGLAAPQVGATTVPPAPPADGGAVPTSEEVAAAAERTAAVPNRFEMFIDLSGIPGAPSFGTDTPFATGSVDGTSSHVLIDASSILGGGAGMPPQLADLDPTMETITIGNDVYLRAPFLATLGDLLGGPTGPLGPFVALGDGWGYVDFAALQGDPADVGLVLGNSSASPTALYEVVTTSSQLEPLGTETIHGVEATGVRATVDFEAMLEAQKIDVAELPGGGEGLADATFPLEVWLGADGYIRRLSFTFDADTLTAAAEATGQSVPTADLAMAPGFGATMTIESFDFDADDIAIEAPADHVDITADFGELLELTQQGA